MHRERPGGVAGYRKTWAAFAALFLPIAVAHAAPSDFVPLAKTLAAVRAVPAMNKMRDAGPELTPVKQQLRVWIEKRIASIGEHADFAALTRQLNEALSAAQLTCGNAQTARKRCEEKLGGEATEPDARGYLGDVAMSLANAGRYLVVKTDVGVRCGFDESAYVYERRGAQWQLLLASEQDRYGEKEYSPQNFLAIDVSPVTASGPARPPLILTLGLSPWCSSNWQVLYARLWRASPSNPTPAPLLDTTDTLYLDDDSVTGSRVTDNDVLFEYHGNSVDDTELVRPHVMHYRVLGGDRLSRVPPVALNPSDFVDEWLTRPWTESGQWSDAGVLTAWYRVLHKRSGLTMGEFDGDTTRCRNDSTLWQVGLRIADAKTDLDPPLHFLVRWLPPYRFAITGISRQPYRGCAVAVPTKKNFDTLFRDGDGRHD